MYLYHNILRIISAVVLSVALILPITVQFIHIFEHHPHVLCTDYTVHLHEQKTDCPICDFHLSSFTFTPLTSVEISIAAINTAVLEIYFFSTQQNFIQHPDSRGPPLFS